MRREKKGLGCFEKEVEGLKKMDKNGRRARIKIEAIEDVKQELNESRILLEMLTSTAKFCIKGCDSGETSTEKMGEVEKFG